PTSYRVRNRVCETRWHSIADLPRNLNLRAAPEELGWEGLKQRGLAMRNRPIDALFGVLLVPLRMEILTLLRLEELGADRQARVAPSHPPHHVGGAGRLVSPARRHQFVRQVEATAAWWDAVVAEERCRLRVATNVNVATLEDARHNLAEHLRRALG